jgi:carboxypeptidase Taq
MGTHYQKIEDFNKRLYRFSHLGSIVGWDEAVNMPEESGDARAEALSELEVFMSQEMKRPEVMEWVEKARQEDLSADQKLNIDLVEKGWKQANVLNDEFVRKQSLTNMKTNQAWRRMRAENDWESFRPHLEEVVKLVQEEAQLRSESTGLDPYDALLDLYEPGLRSSEVETLFNELKAELLALKDAIIEKQSKLPFKRPEGPFPTDKQRDLGKDLMDSLGFNFKQGRLDISHHPFCGGVPEDVRLTTRYSENDFTESLMGIIHETGHARYEQNLPKEWLGQPLGTSKGMAIHEGQSLFFEMQVGRSDEFLKYSLPKMKEYLCQKDDPETWSLENMTRLYQNVEPGFIRVDADEVTYPFHVMIRYEIEKELISGKLAVKDLPEIWDAKMQEYLGLSTKGHYKDGVMQDVHWPSGSLGYFPTYTLGAMVAAQVFQALEKDITDVRADITQGNFKRINEWLTQNIWSEGSRLEINELMSKVTGEKLSTKPFLNHLKGRYLD